MVLVSQFYHNTVIPMSEQHIVIFALRSPAALWRAQGLQQKLFLPSRAEWKKLVMQSCTCTDSSCTLLTSAYIVVKYSSNVRKIRPGDG